MTLRPKHAYELIEFQKGAIKYFDYFLKKKDGTPTFTTRTSEELALVTVEEQNLVKTYWMIKV